MNTETHTTITLTKETRDKLKETKPFDSVSYDDLILDMMEQYEP